LTEASSATRAAVLSNPIDTSVSRNSALALMIVLPGRGGRINAQKLMSGAETIQVDDETPKKLLSFPVNFQRQTGRCPSLRSRKCRRHRFARAAVQRSLRAHRDGGLGRGPSWGPDENVNTLKMGWGVGVLNPGGERAEGWEPRRKKLLATHQQLSANFLSLSFGVLPLTWNRSVIMPCGSPAWRRRRRRVLRP
jgi:hypothetical protein